MRTEWDLLRNSPHVRFVTEAGLPGAANFLVACPLVGPMTQSIMAGFTRFDGRTTVDTTRTRIINNDTNIVLLKVKNV